MKPTIEASIHAFLASGFLCLVSTTCLRPEDESRDFMRSSEAWLLADGSRLAGSVSVGSLTIPEGATVFVDDDLRIQASSHVEIFGTLQVIDRTRDPSRPDAPSVEISAPRLRIAGQILGGSGASYSDAEASDAGQAGGRGSHVVLIGNAIAIDGRVVAGRGGNGGAGAKGGNGGDITLIGDSGTTSSPPRDARRSLVTGKGGKGGRGAFGHVNGGPGGDGGSIRFLHGQAEEGAQ